MNKIKTWLNTKVIPTLGKLGNQRHLSAIRDAFAIFTPLLIVGSLAVVWRFAIFNPGGGTGSISGLFVSYDNYAPSGGYYDFLYIMSYMMLFVQVGTINLMSLYFAFGIGYSLAKSRGNETPVIAGLTSLGVFAASTDTLVGGTAFMGANGLIGALVVCLLFTELFCYLSNSDKLAIKMPDGVPPAVSKSFKRLFPAILTVVAAGALTVLIALPFYFMGATLETGGVTYGADFNVGGNQLITLTSAIFVGIVQPFLSFASDSSAGLGIALFYVLMISFFWFFGLHGTNIINAAFNPVWLLLLAKNQDGGASNIFVQGTFDAYVFIGGWGATLALIIATLIFGKKDSGEKEISKYALPAGIFQINEPVTFGYPLILNAYLIVPLFITMPVLVFMTWLFTGPIGLVPPVIALIPWTMPVGFGGLVGSASAWGFILAIFNLLIAIAIYTPFVLIMKKADSKKLVEAASKTSEGKKAVAKAAKAE